MSVAGAVRFAFDSRTFLSVRVDRRYWSDANQSLASEATLRRILHNHSRFSVDAGLLSHWEHFDHDTQLEAGFFTPDRYAGTMVTWACMANCGGFDMKCAAPAAPSRWPGSPLTGLIGTSRLRSRPSSADGFNCRPAISAVTTVWCRKTAGIRACSLR